MARLYIAIRLNQLLRSREMKMRIDILLLCVMLFLGCQRDGVSMDDISYGDLVVDVATRSDNGVWLSGDQIGVAIVQNGAIEGDGNSCYDANGSGSAVGFSSVYPLSYPIAAEIDVVGYYPYDLSVETMEQLSIDVSDGECDILVARASQCLGEESIVLPFTKLLSTIVLNLHSEEECDDLFLEQVKVWINSVATTATYNVVSDSFELGDIGEIEFTRSSNGDAVLYISAIPQIILSDVSMTFGLSNGTQLSSDDLSISELQSGEVYSYDIFLSDDGVIVKSLLIYDWEDGGSQSGEADAVPAGYIAISNYEEFKAFLNTNSNEGEYPNNGNYILMSDIEVPEAFYKMDFSGIFDGNGHTITKTYSDSVNFGVLFNRNSGVIKNLIVAGDISTNSDSGGIVLENKGTIINCGNEGNITYDGGSISYNLGGIASTNSGYIYNCYNTGTIECSDMLGYAGGIVGDNSGVVKSVYSVEIDVTGDYSYSAGVIAGHNSGSMDYLFAVGDSELDLCGDGDLASGTVATTLPESTFKTSEFAKILTNISYDLMSKRVDDICGWSCVDGNYPKLDFDNTPTYDDSIGLGTEEFPYILSTSSDLYELSREVADGDDKQGVYYLVTNSISLLSTTEEWVPIGTANTPFQGDIAGAYFDAYPTLILSVSSYNTQYNGLFGVVGSSASISGLNVSGTITANYYVGGVAAKSSGSISNCENRVSISTSGAYAIVGGVVGYNSGTITDCSNSGSIDITGSFVTVGSVVGYNSSGASSVTNVSSSVNPSLNGYKSTYNSDSDYVIGYQK